MSGAKIIVIDDEKYVGDSCKEILTDEGYDVETFTDAISAFKYLERESCDVVLLDLKLPGVDGIEILKKIKNKYPEIIVIIITGYASVETAVKSMKFGAYDYIPKPFTTDELSTVVAKAIESKKLLLENKYLQEQLDKLWDLDNLVGESEQMKEVRNLIKKVAPLDTDVLICGESGTGKELVARAIHQNSQRAHKKFVTVDCATLAQTLVESELFGYVKGAFTGATQDKSGLFEIANEGTVFLDEIANVPLEVQAKLLRILQEREFKRIGDTKSKKLNIRFISATNRDLEDMIKEGKFREDLYYRLDVFAICVPPLRERKEDIPLLANYFLKKFADRMHKDIKGFSNSALNILQEYNYPGNVRELKNIIERIIIMADTPIITDKDVLEIIGGKTDGISENNISKIKDEYLISPTTYEELKELKKKINKEIIDKVEKKFLINALNKTGWNITKSAELTGLLRPNFYLLMKKHNIIKEE